MRSRRIYEGRVVNLRVDAVRLPDGREVEREVVEHPGAAAVVPLTERDAKSVAGLLLVARMKGI